MTNKYTHLVPQQTIAPPVGSNLTEPLRIPSGDLLIDGEWVAPSDGGRREAIDPSTGEVLSSFAMATPADVAQAVTAASGALPSWRDWPAQRRRDVLLELARLIDANDLELGVLRSLETGAPLKRKRGPSLAAEWTRYYAGWIDKIEGVTAAPYSGPSRATRCPSHTG